MTWIWFHPSFLLSYTDVVYASGFQPVPTAPYSEADTEGNSRPYSVKMNLHNCPNPTQALTLRILQRGQ